MEHEFKKVMVKGSDIIASSPKQDREYRVIDYDFKRPDKFSLEQIRTLSIVHETFSRLATLSLSSLIQKKVDLHVASVDQMTFEEFIHSIPNPAAMAIINMDALRGSSIMQLDPQICYSIFDRMLGGRGTIAQDNKELTAIERSISSYVFGDLLKYLREAWKPMIDFHPSVGQIETNPQLSMIVPPTEMIVLITFEVKIEEAVGMLNFCIPFIVIEPLLEKLSAQYWYSKVRTNKGDCVPAANIASLKLDCEVLTESEDLSLKLLGELKKGSLVKLPLFAEGKTSLRAGGQIIMDYQMKSHRGGKSFTVQSSSLAQSGLLPDFLHEEEQSERNRQDRFDEISSQLKELAGTLSERIDRISENQVQLTDQVFFQSEGEQPSLRTGKEPFSFIGLPDLPVLHELLADENIQAVALIISRIDSGLGAELLRTFTSEVQPVLMRRVGLMDRVTPEVIGKVESVIRERLDRISESLDPDVKGVEKVTQILNVSSRSVESRIIQSLEKSDGELAEEIKKRMFVFEDIVLLDPKAVAKVADRVDLKDLCLAMKMVAEEGVKEHVLSSISIEKRKDLQKCLEETGRVRISDVDKAQQKVVEAIRKLEEEGEMVVCRPDEMID